MQTRGNMMMMMMMIIIIIIIIIITNTNMFKSRSMRWAGHVALMARRGMHIGYRWESRKEREH
jgi:hypothetical protein